jgi:hypothetical protein
MNRKGVNYDIGTLTTRNTLSRETFDPAIVRREIEIIRTDLRCTAIRISGKDIERLAFAAEYALRQGLEVWFSPTLIDAREQETLTYITECARAAEKLREQAPNLVFVVGLELTAFMRGLVDGNNILERLKTFMTPWRLIKSTIVRGSFNKNLNAFLLKATAMARECFHGQLTYASGSWEEVDWSLFDIVGVNHYRNVGNKKAYRENLRAYFLHGKPVVITEFGCCAYRGGEDKGGYGWAVVDWNKTPPQVRRGLARDETTQARYLIELLEVFEAEAVEGAFVFTFVSPCYPHHENPLYDLDMAGYGVVKTYLNHMGATYKDMPWEPKESFFKLAEYYGMH